MNKRPEQSDDPAWWDAWRGIIFASATVFRQAELDLQEHSGISLTVFDVLSRLYDAPERRLRMQELQERSLFTNSGMTRLVDRIESVGLVRRELVPGDRRGVYVVLSEHGESVYEEAIVKHRADIEREFASSLSPENQAAVAEALWPFWHD
jgi:DNA-binding MarR family transcriptional regulator